MEKIIELKSGYNIAKINLSRGANLILFINSKYKADILRTPAYDNLDNPYLYGMPLLFPINRISGGEFEFQGRSYRFPINEPETGCHIHGFLHDKEFVLEEMCDTYLKCVCIVDETEDFPHKISVTMEYTLSENHIEQKITIENISDYDMPCFLGFHTTFNMPFIKGSSGENVFIKCGVNELIERGSDFLPTGKILEKDHITESLCNGTFVSTGNPLSRHYKIDSEGEIILCDKDKNVSVFLLYSRNYIPNMVFCKGAGIWLCLCRGARKY